MQQQLIRKTGRCLVISFVSTFAHFICAQAGFAAREADKHPTLSTPTLVYDFGSVTAGAKVKFDFPLINKGSADLTIQKVIPSCGCTNSRPSMPTIPPGATGSLMVEFDTTGFSGNKVKLVRMLTNDPHSPTVNFTIKGRVEDEIDLEPKRISFDPIVRGSGTETEAKEVIVRIKSGSSRTIDAVKSFSKSVIIKEIKGGDKERTLAVSLLSDLPVGEFRDRLVISLKGGSAKTVNIPIYASVVGEVSLIPSSLSFGLLEGKEPLERSVRLDNAGKTPLEVGAIKSDTPAVTASLTEIQKGKRYVIKVRVDPLKLPADKDLKGMVTVATGSDTLTLSVYGAFPPRK